jgi:hypothetical protein
MFKRPAEAFTGSTMLFKLSVAFSVLLAASAIAAGSASAKGGSYLFAGGTKAQQGTVKAALDASAFDWSLVPARITIHIGHYSVSEASKGELWLDKDLLNAGIYSWGVVQHEYGHEVDYYMLTDPLRVTIKSYLGGKSWYQTGGISHGDLTAERFASTVAWAYWPSPYNVMKPTSKSDEAAHMAPAAFRQLLTQQLGVPDTLKTK